MGANRVALPGRMTASTMALRAGSTSLWLWAPLRVWMVRVQFDHRS